MHVSRHDRVFSPSWLASHGLIFNLIICVPSQLGEILHNGGRSPKITSCWGDRDQITLLLVSSYACERSFPTGREIALCHQWPAPSQRQKDTMSY